MNRAMSACMSGSYSWVVRSVGRWVWLLVISSFLVGSFGAGCSVCGFDIAGCTAGGAELASDVVVATRIAVHHSPHRFVHWSNADALAIGLIRGVAVLSHVVQKMRIV